MYKPKRLKIVNLLSHQMTEYKFVNGQATLVTGENKDDDGQESNGAGKSGLIEGISIAITGKPLRPQKDADLIFYGADECTVEMEFQNDILKESLLVSRNLFAKKSKSSTITIKVNNVDQKDYYPTVLDANKWLLAKLGVSREDIINYYIVSKSKSLSFFSQSNTEKEKVISRFSNTESLLPIRAELKEELKGMDAQLEQLRKDEHYLELGLKSYQDQLEALGDNTEAESNKALRIADVESAIDEKSSMIAKSEVLQANNLEEVEKLTKLKEEAERSLNEFKAVDHSARIDEVKSKISEADKEIEAKIKELDENTQQAGEFKSFRAEIEQNIADSIQCPKCSHSFIIRDEEYDVESAKAQLPEIDAMLEHFAHEEKRIKSEGAGVRESKTQLSVQLREIESEVREQNSRKLNLEANYGSLGNKITSAMNSVQMGIDNCIQWRESIKELEGDIQRIKEEKVPDLSLPIKKNIEEAEQALEAKKEEIETFKTTLVEKKEFEVIFNKFITHLSNKSVKSIENLTNQYLVSMGSSLSIEIEGYKINADGAIKPKLTTIVSRDGIEEGLLGGMSEGEQSRIIIAGTLALNALMNMSCGHGKGIDLAVLDELMGSLDRLGVQLAMEALDELNQTIIAISHVEPRNVYSNTIKIVKENGNSELR